MAISQPIAYSLLGGIAAQLLTFIDGIKAPPTRRPDYSSWEYYVGIAFNLVLSIIVGMVYFDESQKVNKIVYFHVGASAPLIMRSLISSIPRKN